MKVAILILSIVGVVMSFAVGACTGMCMSGLGELSSELGDAATATEANEMGASMFLWAILQAAMGLAGGIIGFRNFEIKKKARLSGILLIIAALISLHNTMQFFTSGLLFLIPAIMVLVSGGKGDVPVNQPAE